MTFSNPFRKMSKNTNAFIYIFHKIFESNLNFTVWLQFSKIIPSKKFLFLIDSMENNLFSKEEKEIYFQTFFICQKVYRAFSKLAFIFKHKKYPVHISTDLCLNEINTLKTNNICILQENKKYWFLLRDLVNIIVASLTNSNRLISQPLKIKNPYNNVPFNKSTLYNIYFKVRESELKINDIFHYFFTSHFNLTNFSRNYEYLIRDYAIKNYEKTLTISQSVSLIESFLEEFNKSFKRKTNKIIIHDDFPKDKLVHVMKQFFNTFLLSKYSLLPTQRNECQERLKIDLTKFKLANPCFGRKVFKKQLVGGKTKTVYSFITDAINPNDFCKVHFLDDHLGIKKEIQIAVNDNVEEDFTIEREDNPDENEDEILNFANSQGQNPFLRNSQGYNSEDINDDGSVS
jgi:hypothetical protein